MRRRWARAGVVTTAVVAACEFQHGSLGGGPPGDSGPDTPPDAAICTGLTDECLGDIWRHCAGPGATAVDTVCGWGCSTMQSSVSNTHCVVVSPAGNGGSVTMGASPSDTLADAMLVDVTLAAGVQIDGDLGKMGVPPTPDLRGSGGIGIVNGIDFQRRGPVSVFRFKSLTIDGPISLIGTHSIVLVADGEIKINNVIDARGPCTTTLAGPGGGTGGASQGGDGSGSSGGLGSDVNNLGGGGGGNGGPGGNGGNSAANSGAGDGGAAIVDPAILTLVGGGGGAGGGGGGMAGAGGGGGGAVQLISNKLITISTNGGINAGGCGGQSGAGTSDGGGGGGAGGTILLEVPKLVIAGKLAVNGGGGGGGDAGNQNRGQNGSLDRQQANGANGMANGGAAAAGSDVAEAGANTGGKGGGGGGGIGRIRLNTRNGSADVDLTGSVLSPQPNEPNNTTCTIGTAATAP